MVELTRKEYNLIAKNRGIIKPRKMSIQELKDTFSRYDSRLKVKSNRRKLLKIKLEKIAKIQNISKNELNKAEKLQMDELQGIARLRRIKNRNNLTREDLILISLLKSESNPVERNYVKYFNISTNDDDDDDTYDDKIKHKINDIRMILARLGYILIKNDRKKIKKELYEIDKKQYFSDNEKKRFMIILSN